ncbi:MAG TPA: hypothetical protein VKA53_02785, partial [Thermoanaerobaculia bacterium]|nr:hypothetical protein [Thermoanaerobaculia bacterium]
MTSLDPAVPAIHIDPRPRAAFRLGYLAVLFIAWVGLTAPVCGADLIGLDLNPPSTIYRYYPSTRSRSRLTYVPKKPRVIVTALRWSRAYQGSEFNVGDHASIVVVLHVSLGQAPGKRALARSGELQVELFENGHTLGFWSDNVNPGAWELSYSVRATALRTGHGTLSVKALLSVGEKLPPGSIAEGDHIKRELKSSRGGLAVEVHKPYDV